MPLKGVSICEYPENIGQHVAWNYALDEARSLKADYFLRIDDDCEFLTFRWLKKLVAASETLQDEMILAPLVKGLRNPPKQSEPIHVKGIPLSFVVGAIGGVCRLHPMKLLEKHGWYYSDVRSALGAGDATGIARWCQDRYIPMAYTRHIRVRHPTTLLETNDPEHTSTHDLFQVLPYIPV